MGYELDWEFEKGNKKGYCKLNNIKVTKENLTFGACGDGEKPLSSFFIIGEYTIYTKKGGTQVSKGDINIPYPNKEIDIIKYVYEEMKKIPGFENSKMV